MKNPIFVLPVAALCLMSAKLSFAKLGPNDFYCRPLSSSTTAALANGLSGQSYGWNPAVKQTWDANPDLQKSVLEFMQQSAGKPRYFKGGVGGCTTSRDQGTCQQTVECAVIPSDVQTRVEQEYQKLNSPDSGKKAPRTPFAKIDAAAKEKYLEALAPNILDWKISSVTCTSYGVNGSAGPSCPPPEHCKNDIEREGQDAGVDTRFRTQSGIVVPSVPASSSSSSSGSTSSGAAQ